MPGFNLVGAPDTCQMSVNSLFSFAAICCLLSNLCQAQGVGSPPGIPELQPGDVVRLQIWREPDLSGEFLVDQSGIVTFPMLGSVLVATESALSLKARLVKAYQVFLRNPSIEVTHLRRVVIVGAVKAPGVYPLDPTLTISDAVAVAGGATPDGKRDEIELVRAGERSKVRLTDLTRIADLGLRSGDQIFIPQRSWIARNPGLVATAVSAGVSLIIAVFIR